MTRTELIATIIVGLVTVTAAYAADAPAASAPASSSDPASFKQKKNKHPVKAHKTAQGSGPGFAVPPPQK